MNRLNIYMFIMLLLTISIPDRASAMWLIRRPATIAGTNKNNVSNKAKDAPALKSRLMRPLPVFIMGSCLTAGWLLARNYEKILATAWVRRLFHLPPLPQPNDVPKNGCHSMNRQPVHAREERIRLRSITKELVLVDDIPQYRINVLELAPLNGQIPDFLACLTRDKKITCPECTIFIACVVQRGEDAYTDVIIKIDANGNYGAFWSDKATVNWHQKSGRAPQSITNPTIFGQYTQALEQFLPKPDGE